MEKLWRTLIVILQSAFKILLYPFAVWLHFSVLTCWLFQLFNFNGRLHPSTASKQSGGRHTVLRSLSFSVQTSVFKKFLPATTNSNAKFKAWNIFCSVAYNTSSRQRNFTDQGKLPKLAEQITEVDAYVFFENNFQLFCIYLQYNFT